MKWEDYEKLKPVKSYDCEPRTQVNVECPQCGKKIWRKNNTGVVLTVYPPIYEYEYECECGWSGLAGSDNMKNYDYREAIKKDIETYIKYNNLQVSDLNIEALYNQLIEEDTVTGWGYLYYDTEEKCKEYLRDNYILLTQAVQEYCEKDEMDNEYALDLFIGNSFASYYDSVIRRYLLKEALNEVIEEHKNGKI